MQRIAVAKREINGVMEAAFRAGIEHGAIGVELGLEFIGAAGGVG